jgi:hypothetical protein
MAASVERIVVDSDSTYPDTGIIRDISTGNIAIDYSKYLERIAHATETMASDVAAMKALATGAGIKTNDPLAWIGLMSVYKLYAEDPGSMGLDALKAYKAKIDAMVESLG